MRKKQNEKKIVKDSFQRLKAEVGGFWWKVHGGIFQLTGLPDICGCVCGLYVHIEAKDGNNEASAIQITRIKEIREAGGLAFVYWDVEVMVRRVKKYVKKHAIQSPSKSRKIIQKSKADRTIHGAGDWENNHRFRSSSSKTKKGK